MGVLLSTLWEERYHSQHTLHGQAGQTTRVRGGENARQTGGRIRHEALHAGSQPDHTGVPDALLGGDPHQREGQAIEGMGGINDLDGVPGKNC